MFDNFEPSLFNDPEFKEDGVREVVIVPILTRLGYRPSGPNRIIRSKSLEHPFIYVGTKKLAVKLIPDYTLLGSDRVILVLDAKHPSENIADRKNVQQVYSYAIHPEIKCNNFALCNGRSLSVWSVDSNQPLLFLNFDEFEAKWDNIEKCMGPKFLKEPMLRRFAPDFGCAIARLGFREGGSIVLLPAQFNLFAKLNDNMITATANVEFAEKPHCVSFDFNKKLLNQLLSGLPTSLADLFIDSLNKAPFQVAAELAIEADVETKLGAQVDGRHEIFRPLIIHNVIAARFKPMPIDDMPDDIPDNVFRLRKSYRIGEGQGKA